MNIVKRVCGAMWLRVARHTVRTTYYRCTDFNIVIMITMSISINMCVCVHPAPACGCGEVSKPNVENSTV